MVIRLYGAGLEGVDAFPVDVEVDLVRQGLPGFTLVGLAALGAIPGLLGLGDGSGESTQA